MQEFKFELGEIVATRVALAEAGLGRTPVPFQVLEQRRQICPGGEQLHYLLHCGRDHVLFLEFELLSWDSDETKAAIASAQRVRDVRAERHWASATAIIPQTEPKTEQEAGD